MFWDFKKLVMASMFSNVYVFTVVLYEPHFMLYIMYTLMKINHGFTTNKAKQHGYYS